MWYVNMAGQKVTRRQKDISRLLREKKRLLPGDKKSGRQNMPVKNNKS
ncbi:MAG TPA: hypothetical protein PKZ12_00760 [Smithellaceae bacterium]|nr:hypothetical protein [Smithellaceae bacterium]